MANPILSAYWNPSNNHQAISKGIRLSSHTQITNEFNKYIGQEFSGEDFNKLFPDTKFVKLTSETENHNGFQFNDGLNVDTMSFNPFGTCLAGGIYFTDIQKAYMWFKYNASVMKYFRDVTIPDDARVYIEENKFKADKMLLGPRNVIGQDIIKQVIELNGFYLQYVKEQTNEMCILAVQRYGSALQYVNEQTEYICKLAVQQDGSTLKYVKEQTHEICILAIQQYCHALKYVKIQTPEICILAVQQNGYALRHIQEQTEELCILAVQKCGLALEYVETQTDNICKLAVQQDGLSLEFVNEQTAEICKLAVQQNGRALKYVKEQFKTEELRELKKQYKIEEIKHANFRYL